MAKPDGSATSSPPPPHPRAMKMLLGTPLTARRAARIIASVTIFATVVGGVLVHFADKKTFPNVGDGMWWSIQTVTTVGYGDIVPSSAWGRTVASLVMLAGIGFLTVVTASITSTFIESARRRLEGNTAERIATQLDQISARLDAIEAGLEGIARR
jgi:voltage-gated potassium channel